MTSMDKFRNTLSTAPASAGRLKYSPLQGRLIDAVRRRRSCLWIALSYANSKWITRSLRAI